MRLIFKNSCSRRSQSFHWLASLTVAIAAVSIVCPAYAADIPVSAASLDHGFNLLYDLDFAQAHQVFLSWEQQHANNPLGVACDAAGLLFSEFDRLGVLEAQFYTNDKAFAERQRLNPDPGLRDRFNAAIDRAETLARAQLAKDPKDRDALFAMTLASGLQADYAAMIEKRNLVSLHYTKDANAWAQQLLQVDPHAYDAYLATGFSKYIIGSMSAPVRWLVRLDGVSGDKQAGIAELKMTAEHGHYLAPFARILMAIACVRDKNKAGALSILASLRQQFPQNPLFGREISRLDAAR